MAISRGFRGRRRGDVDPARVPPGQYITPDFPVLSAGPTPHTPLSEWTFEIRGAVDGPMTWTSDLSTKPAATHARPSNAADRRSSDRDSARNRSHAERTMEPLWSPWLQPVATGGKCRGARNRENKQKPLP
jgi:hypothetical protein